ncbi:kinase-like domain-containing protein [Sporodiniella umbellata]|nr:kinase-like domain-containing protein [Sporodiniella umbellata]
MSFTRFLVKDPLFPVDEKPSVKEERCKKRGGTDSQGLMEGMGPIRNTEWAEDETHACRHNMNSPVRNGMVIEEKGRLEDGPSRQLPPNQAILTTDPKGRLWHPITVHDLGLDSTWIGDSFLKRCLQEPFRRRMADLLERRLKIRVEAHQKEMLYGATITTMRHPSDYLVQPLSAPGRLGDSVEAMTDRRTIDCLLPQMPMLLSKLGTADSRLCRAWIARAMRSGCHGDQSKVRVEVAIPQDNRVRIANDPSHAAVEHAPRREMAATQPPRPSRISSFGTVDEAKRLFPPSTTDASAAFARPRGVNEKHPLDDYVVLDALGQGTYGMAKLAYRKDDPCQKKLVIKYILKSKIVVDSWIRDRQLGSIPMEIHILNTLRNHPHQNCCRLVTSMEDEDCYFVVMDLLGDGMALFDYIETNPSLAEGEIRHLFHQVAKAVQHLHTHRIVHRDIKDENIILDQHGTLHLIDFGCAAYYRQGRKFDTFTGTLEYCAPEIVKGNPYEGPPQDVWACGILLFTLIYRENPFNSLSGILESDLNLPFVLSQGKPIHINTLPTLSNFRYLGPHP